MDTVRCFPASFTTANILGLKKKAGAVSPLEFRLIALLNTDYKVYTRMYACRLRDHAWRLVHPLQNGFVPRREIHTTLDVFYAAKALAKVGKLSTAAAALLVDFEKAYDALRRIYLFWILRSFGFPPRFLAIVEALHTGTNCRFLVNGFKSKTAKITTVLGKVALWRGCYSLLRLTQYIPDSSKMSPSEGCGWRRLRGPTSSR